MNFYSVKVGKRTRKGHFNEDVSFVCETLNNSASDVQYYWTNHYVGFDVLVEPVKQIIKKDIKETINFGKIEKAEVRDLRSEINDLKEKLKPKSITHFKGIFAECNYTNEIDDMIEEIRTTKSKLYNLKETAKKAIESHLQKINTKYSEWTRADKGFNNDFSEYSYELRLKGNLITHNQDEETN